MWTSLGAIMLLTAHHAGLDVRDAWLLTVALPPLHQHRLHWPHVHVLPRQPLKAGHQGQPLGLGAAARAPAPVAAGPAPVASSRPAGALIAGVARATGRVTFVALAVVGLVQPPRPVLPIAVLVSRARGAGLGGRQLDFSGTLDRLSREAE